MQWPAGEQVSFPEHKDRKVVQLIEVAADTLGMNEGSHLLALADDGSTWMGRSGLPVDRRVFVAPFAQLGKGVGRRRRIGNRSK